MIRYEKVLLFIHLITLTVFHILEDRHVYHIADQTYA